MDALRHYIREAVPSHLHRSPVTVVGLAGNGLSNSQWATFGDSLTLGRGVAEVNVAHDVTYRSLSQHHLTESPHQLDIHDQRLDDDHGSSSDQFFRLVPCHEGHAPAMLLPALLARHGLHDLAIKFRDERENDRGAVAGSTSTTGPYIILLQQRGRMGNSCTTDASALFPLLLAPAGVLVWALSPSAVPARMVLNALERRFDEKDTVSHNQASTAAKWSVSRELKLRLLAALAPLTDTLSFATLVEPPTTGEEEARRASLFSSEEVRNRDSGGSRKALVVLIRVGLSPETVSKHKSSLTALFEELLGFGVGGFGSGQLSPPALATEHGLAGDDEVRPAVLLSRFFGRTFIDVSSSVSTDSFAPSAPPAVVRLAAECLLDSAHPHRQPNNSSRGFEQSVARESYRQAAGSNIDDDDEEPTFDSLGRRLANGLAVIDRLGQGLGGGGSFQHQHASYSLPLSYAPTSGTLDSSPREQAGHNGSPRARSFSVAKDSSSQSTSAITDIPLSSTCWMGSHAAPSAVGAALLLGGHARGRVGSSSMGGEPHHSSSSTRMASMTDALSYHGQLYSTANGYAAGLLRLVRGGTTYSSNTTDTGHHAILGRSNPCVPLPAYAVATLRAEEASTSVEGGPLQRLRESFVLNDASNVLKAMVSWALASQTSNEKTVKVEKSCIKDDATNELGVNEEEEGCLGDSASLIATISNGLRALLLGGGACSDTGHATFMSSAMAMEESRSREAAEARKEAKAERKRLRVSLAAHALLDELEILDEWVESERQLVGIRAN